ncbi:MAG: hypothetical protein IJE43_14880 [Alphaproteobacteria bacterium]|nr:hypothetical protein [Alphaproteobacteria bacterium]
MEKEKYTSCEECKYYYDLDIVGFHNTCAIGCCYLCAARYKSCNWFEKGAVPGGKAHGNFIWEKERN